MAGLENRFDQENSMLILDEIFKFYEKKFPIFGFSLRLKLPRIIKSVHQPIHDTLSDLL